MELLFHRMGLYMNYRLAILTLALAHAATVLPAQSTDSVTIAASTLYSKPGLINRVLLGSNYRKVWETPVRLPVFHLSEHGFTIKELGGGNQTLSLQLTDRKGRSWSLRTVDKNVVGALPPFMQKTIVVKLAQEQVSGAHPYAPLIVARLAKAVGVRAADPVYYFVPDDPALGEYRSLFAGSVCLLEEREPGESRSQNTGKILERLIDKGSARADGPAILKARLLDIIVGDWDRHSDQWRWAARPGSRDLPLVYALPRDRDQALYYTDGVLPRLMQLVALRYLISYNDDLKRIKSLTYKSWPFDRFFLSGVDREQWTGTLQYLHGALTDSVLLDAVKALPPEIYAISGKRLYHQLQGRRDDLVKQGLKYYRFLSGYVDIYGTDKDDEFVISGVGDTLRVQVFLRKDGVRGAPFYERVFQRSDTRLLRLWAFHGKDKLVTDKGKSAFKFEFYTDDGDDELSIDAGKKLRLVR
jgi:hypothetical protein